MSNRSFLLNTAILTSEIAKKMDFEYMELSEGSNRILIPWICCFRKNDLKPAKYSAGNFELNMRIPSTDLKSALSNLESSKWVFESLCGDEKVAEAYWRAAVEGLKTATLPYVTADPLEVFFLSNPQEQADKFASCFLDDTVDIDALKEVCEFIDQAEPYPIEELYKAPGRSVDQNRLFNSTLLDGGYSTPKYRMHYIPRK